MSTLPSFTFNSADSSGLQQTPTTTPPKTPEEEAPTTPSRRGHRRGGSEFVGGDSRLGVSNAVSTSPTKANAPSLPVPTSGPPAGRRGHSHRRSAAISSHDLSNIMRPAEDPPRTSSSLPSTPMEYPGQTPPLDRATSAPDVRQDPFGPPLDEQSTRPPSRPRVGFSDNVEIIPRPLSTISSETESSMSTIRGHSVNNSISSVLSLGTPSPPSTRPSKPNALSAPLENEPKPRAKSSIEISRRVEKEGEWLKSRSSQSLKRPLSESAAAPPKTTFVEPEAPPRRRQPHKKKQSLSHALGFDRRRSEPVIGVAADAPSRNSAVSLGSISSVSDGPACPMETTSSTKRLKAWATAKMSKKPKESNRAISESSSRSSMRPESSGSSFVPGKVTASEAAAETNLDAVLGSETPKASREQERPASPAQPRIEVSSASPTFKAPSQSVQDDEDDSAMLDLDAALGPFKTPPLGGAQRQRKELHSSRLTRDFTGPGGHYHRRAESAPALPPFESSRVSTPSQSSMADVFEEEEEEDEEDAAAARNAKPASTTSASEEESGIGISVVDSASAGAGGHWNLGSDDGLGIDRGGWEPERPSTSYSNAASRLSTSGTDQRRSSVIEETIFEEASPVETPAASAVEIVEAEDEPRASSLTKSSDSSETPTLLGPNSLFPAADGPHSTTTPDTYQTSNFSSPDFSRRQASFDASRIGTAASSIADTRTTSSCTTGEHGSEVRMSVDDVPSLTSSRSTMLSTAQANHSQRNVNETQTNTPTMRSASDGAALAAEHRSKRGSIASLSQLLSSKSRDHDEARPKTSADSSTSATPAKKKEHRLKKLMFWKAKHGGSSSRSGMRSQP